MAVVVSIVPYRFLPAKIGGQKGIALFNQFFAQYQKFICLTIEDNDNTLAQGYETIKTFSNSKFRYINPANFFKVRSILKDRKATHLLMEHPYFGWLAYLLKKSTGIKLVVHSHNIEALRFKTIGKWWWKILWHYEKWIHRNADYNFFIHAADRTYAIETLELEPSKCIVMTYGVSIKEAPAKEEVYQSKQWLRNTHGIKNDEKILLFAGSFNYKPNLDAVKVIEEYICPYLDKMNFPYKVIICGPWMEPSFTSHPNMILAGFVDLIEPYFIGSDVFLNTVMDGGGIKTKLVESLAYNCNAVSTIDGSTGVEAALCNGKMFLVEDGDWKVFAEQVMLAAGYMADTPPQFYQHYYWGYSTKRAAEFIEIHA